MLAINNQATAGDYKGWVLYIDGKNRAFISELKLFGSKKVYINEDTVESYEVIGADSNVSTASAATRGAVGYALLGPLGIAAALTAKKKGIHTIAINFTDGKNCVIETDNNMYQSITSILMKIKKSNEAKQQVIEQQMVAQQQPAQFQAQPTIVQQSNISVADEIMKFKELLDGGVISQEEFDTKKKQLLNM